MYLKVFWRLGKKVRMWLNQLKVAVVQKDIELLGGLLDDIPEFSEPKEIEEILFLLKEATAVMKKRKDETRVAMVQMKKNIDFLESTKVDKISKFDIIS